MGTRKPMANRQHDNTLVLDGGERGSWTPHDLRRTGATTMQGLGISLDIIDRCQNHVLGGSKVRRHYLLHNYADEKRDAWAKLGRDIESIIESVERSASDRITAVRGLPHINVEAGRELAGSASDGG